jgi:hypothetical protein
MMINPFKKKPKAFINIDIENGDINMTQEFIPGVWYPLNWSNDLPDGAQYHVIKMNYSDIDKPGWGDKTHFTPKEKIVIEPPKIELPTVPEFLRDGVKVGDLVFFNTGGCRFVISIQSKFHNHPINTRNRCNARAFSLGGWGRYKGAKDGDMHYLHIVRIERNGVTVAEGQVYDD